MACTSVSSAMRAARSAAETPPALLELPSLPTLVASLSLYSMNCLRLANCNEGNG